MYQPDALNIAKEITVAFIGRYPEAVYSEGDTDIACAILKEVYKCVKELIEDENKTI